MGDGSCKHLLTRTWVFSPSTWWFLSGASLTQLARERGTPLVHRRFIDRSSLLCAALGITIPNSFVRENTGRRPYTHWPLGQPVNPASIAFLGQVPPLSSTLDLACREHAHAHRFHPWNTT